MPSPFTALMPLLTLAWPFVALAVVVALILISQRVVRVSGFYRRHAGQRLSVVEAMALDPRRRLHLIRCDDRTLLLLTGGTEDLVVGWLPEVQP
jgi:flagellar protein FliO/FliZ